MIHISSCFHIYYIETLSQRLAGFVITLFFPMRMPMPTHPCHWLPPIVSVEALTLSLPFVKSTPISAATPLCVSPSLRNHPPPSLFASCHAVLCLA